MVCEREIAEIRHAMVAKVRLVAGYPVTFSELGFFVLLLIGHGAFCLSDDWVWQFSA